MTGMTDELREARGLLAELSGKLTAYAEYVPAIYAVLLRQRAEQIDAFLAFPADAGRAGAPSGLSRVAPSQAKPLIPNAGSRG